MIYKNTVWCSEIFKEHNRNDSVPSIRKLPNQPAGALRVTVTAELAASTSYSSMMNSGVGATTSKVFRSTTVRTCTHRLLQFMGSEVYSLCLLRDLWRYYRLCPLSYTADERVFTS